MLWVIPIGLIVLAVAWIWLMMWWNYSSGERAGWVQKFSRKGWICKTWEGELALVTMPGTAQEKFVFTVRDDDVAQKLNAVMGQRVSLHYEEKVGLPGTCFGDTRYWVKGVKPVEEIPLAPGIVVPTRPNAAQAQPSQPGAAPAQLPQPASAPAQPAQAAAPPAPPPQPASPPAAK
jgi:hypothetical protein